MSSGNEGKGNAQGVLAEADSNNIKETAELAELVHATRALVDQVRRTQAPSEELAAARETILELTAQLDAWAHHGPYAQASLDGSPGVIGQSQDPMAMFPYSPLIGRLNPLAPPATFHNVDGRVVGEVTLGPAYCGPPNHAHGGVVAALMDELLGVVNVIHDLGAMTGRLIVHYRSPTPLNVPLRIEGEHVRSEGRKIFSAGRMWHGDVLLCEAEGLFIRPKDGSLFSSLVRRNA